jgi:hypothetical protein
MAKVWRSADIFILASRYEGTSIAMLEAMAQGCVPIVTRVSGVAGVIQPGQNGFWVPIGDMSGMAHLIKMLDNQREQLVELGGKAYSTVATGFSYQDYLGWFRSLMDEVWDQSPRPWPHKGSVSWLQPPPQILNKSPEEVIYGLTSEDIARKIPTGKIFKAIGLKARLKLGRMMTKRFNYG